MKDHLAVALSAIQALRSAATRGDAEAAAGLVKVGLSAARHVNALATHPEGYPGRVAIDSVASESDWWPVQVGAMKEWRTPDIPELLGINLGVKIKGRRDLDYRTRTGFTLSIMSEMDATRLPSLSADNVSKWVDAAMAHLEINCQGSFESFPWPGKIKADADTRLGENKDMETALRHVIRESWLKYGFKQLAK